MNLTLFYHYRRCGKRFYTKFGYILTLHFVHMMAEVDAGATIEIRDGSDDTNANLIKVIFILIFLLIFTHFY